MSKGFASSYRIVLLAGGLLICFGGLGTRLVWLHVIKRDELLLAITKVRHQLIVEKARRGDIRDTNGALLATSYSRIVLGVDPTMVRPEDEKKIPQLSALLGMPEAELRRIFTTKFREAAPAAPASHAASPGVQPAGLVFNLNLPGAAKSATTPASPTAPAAEDSEADTELEPASEGDGRRAIRWAKVHDDVSEQLNLEIEKLGLKCLVADRAYRRTYPQNQLAAHLVGYVNHQQEATAGMEAYADFYLRGQNGWRVGERDGRNRELAQFRSRHVPPSDGYTVYLTINAAVQNIVEQELAYIAQKFQPLKASIIVSNPRNGFILGMANYPTFDPNKYNQVPKEESARLKNAAVADIYDPGSVFKIVAAAGALEEKLVTPQTVFDCSLEQIFYTGRLLKLPGEDHRMGMLSVSEIISHSSNRGVAQLGLKLGGERLYRYARSFGFGGKLGFPVGGEVSGILNPYKEWHERDIVIIPMGHSISSTVLQMHQAMSVIAADGVLLRPQIIREIRDGSEKVFRYDRAELHRVVSKETARTVARMLMGVAMKNGTAPEAAIENFDVAGKTGTSQKFIDGEWSKRHHVASFVGFFPAVGGPGVEQVAISVIVDDADARAPGGIAYGKSVAAPSFKNI
ncbi:MAG TPA: penicillin-binding protein 2, partial [Opitutaceae bacterium]|nr:penicillin-binding protein 2 [Opitutaceae bacterium]